MEYPLCLICAKFNFADGLTVFAIALLLLCSSFFSASETAFSTANALRIKNYADEKVKGARRAQWRSNMDDGNSSNQQQT